MDRKLILFVEDSEHDRELYGKLLWYNGFDVEFATDGAQGLRLLESARPRLVVLDLQLPDLSGMDVCQRIRADERTSHVPVIILTGRPWRECAAWAESMGCAGFLEKPVTPLELLYEVERVIGRAPLPGDIVAAERGPADPASATIGVRAAGSAASTDAARNPFERMAGDPVELWPARSARGDDRASESEPEPDAGEDPQNERAADPDPDAGDIAPTDPPV